MKEKIKQMVSYAITGVYMIVMVALLLFPVALPYIVDFHPLLVAPYYGILWWVAFWHYIMRKQLLLASLDNTTSSDW